MIYLDTETCGLHGPIVLLQWAENNGPIQIYNVWKNPIYKTLELIKYIVDHSEGVCGFNLAFDWFHICQTYTTLSLFEDKSLWPEDAIDTYAVLEEKARRGPCLKPQGAFDIMLHARKGEYQSTMDRADIRIKRVPAILSYELRDELEKRIPLKDIYFARYKDKTEKWIVQDILDDFGHVVEDFKDIVLKFAPSSALKALAADALGVDTEKIKLFTQVEPPKNAFPKELGYAPYAMAIGKPGEWNGAWPDLGKIRVWIDWWEYNNQAREYASDDVKYTRDLYKYFGSPKINDIDSILACMVGAVRWKGFALDLEKLKKLASKSENLVKKIKKKFNFESSTVCRIYLGQVLDETERLALIDGDKISTKAIFLQEIKDWKINEVCDCQGLDENCFICGGDGLIPSNKKHPAAIRAQEILDARHEKKRLEVYEKLLKAKRFHASFKVTGAKSHRMSGSDGLNPQGINRGDTMRSCFTFADSDRVLDGGDFDAFEVSIMDAVYNDPKLKEDLLSGKKIHAIFATYLFPGKTYEQIMATKGASLLEHDLYTRGKNGFFAISYMGNDYTLKTRVGVTVEVANEAIHKLFSRYTVMSEGRDKATGKFCSAKQPGGLGTKVEWHEPADYIESIFGFRRYFTLENRICKALFDLAENPPKEWLKVKLKVVRRDRKQTAGNAIRTALFAAMFALQAANMRAAGNHIIQSPGATITKMLQACIWEVQPSGIHEWLVQPMNTHDEIESVNHLSVSGLVEAKVKNFIQENKKHIPLLKMKWKRGLKNWAEK